MNGYLIFPFASLIGASWLAGIEGLYSLSILMPWLYWQSRSRISGFACWVAYYAAGSIDITANYQTMMDTDDLLIPLASWVGCAITLSIPWLLAWTTSKDPSVQFKRTALALAASILPPLGLIGWLNPLLLSGLLFPGLGNTGLLLMAIALCGWGLSSASWVKHFRTTIASCAVIANICFAPQPAPLDWIALDTHFGPPPAPDQRNDWKDRIRKLNDGAIDMFNTGWKVVIFPEYASGYWGPLFSTWWIGADIAAANTGGTVIFGASEVVSKGKEINRVMLLKGGGAEPSSAPLPMPVGMWRPWADRTTIAFPFSPAKPAVAGKQTHIAVCYEEFLILPKLLAMNTGQRPEVSIGIASNWFAAKSSSFIQHESHRLMADLYGIPMLRSVAY